MAQLSDRAAASRKFTPYPDYRDSGVDWLGQIPAHWEVRRLKTLAAVELSNVDKKSVEGQEAVHLCNYTDVYYNEHITRDLEFMLATATHEQVRRFSLRAGDVLITKDSESWTDIAVSAVVVEEIPGVLCGYHLAHIRPGANYDGAFLSRAFAAAGLRDQFRVAANGITRFGLSGDAIRTALFVVPPETEQHGIAAFLDRESARIDALVGKKVRLIKLLHEERIALITRAVTKGLDPNVSMKDSGVEWLGEIPAHWELRRLRSAVMSSQNGVWGDEPDGVGDTVCIRVADFDRVAFRVHTGELTFRSIEPSVVVTHSLRPGNLLLEKSGGGEKQLVGAVVLFDHELPAVCSNFVARLFISEGHQPRYHTYLHAALYAQRVNVRHIKQSTGIQNLDSDSYLNEEAGLPPDSEQRTIADFLDQETKRIDSLVEKVRHAIETLKELRITMISAAVTGKIDVREEVA
jgi:type I restriction enzyme, S subunit